MFWLYITLIVIVFNVKAQQLPLYANYAFSTYGHNPAFAGHNRRVEGILTHRNHLAGFPGAPTTQLFTASMPIQKYYMGTGIKVIHDRIGITRSTSFSCASNYTITFADGKLTAGLELGFQQYGIDWDKLELNDPDNALPNTNTNVIIPNGGFGLFYDKRTWYVGYSVLNLIKSKLNLNETSSQDEARLKRHNYIQAGMAIELKNSPVVIEPHTLIKYVVNAPPQVDIGGFASFKRIIGGGMAFRSGDAIYFTMKYQYQRMLSIGYNYGIRVNSLARYSGNSHEFMISYFYPLMPPPSKVDTNPIWFIRN